MSDFGRRGGWWVAGQVVLFGAFAWAVGAGRSVPTAVAVFGWMLVAAGVALAGGGLLALGVNLTPYPEPRDDGRLVDRGVYRLARHPIYGGIGLGAVGLAVARGSWAALAIGIGLVGYFWLKSHREERRLAAAYPEYGAYQARVRARLVPWLF